jgi:hypothetical protein
MRHDELTWESIRHPDGRFEVRETGNANGWIATDSPRTVDA